MRLQHLIGQFLATTLIRFLSHVSSVRVPHSDSKPFTHPRDVTCTRPHTHRLSLSLSHPFLFLLSLVHWELRYCFALKVLQLKA
ncbi:hypothetical protein RJT34_27383 [Clitoria ternatea]|uniref:Uncharacterized protein n=1 Tax=Clitoria ternatea TaxID=43366 RepID=A0AAN9FGG2_CLITE